MSHTPTIWTHPPASRKDRANAMQLLLFLSAILTALTGVVTGRVVAPQEVAAASAVADAATVQTAVRAVLPAGQRPLAALIPVEPIALADFALRPAVALWHERRRE
ncbi:hypothetical protein PQ455_08060 [Sphingomonas naphthae]|uniref:Uncharacterized protein n=1 Tax=Sphingomonas naphthae TaxID=1813468 RepID=A0ABY7TQ58_9SPHN|nr:hypothetical protein [Sphingomonas naphthae]WCT75158.1 hypothetical protein PQ455_08060 [Sphingomonas naphthae]